MKKELFAGLTIIMLIIGSISNVTHLRKTVNQLNTIIQNASLSCSIEDYAHAEEELTKALDIWLSLDNYTHVFIRHSEVDTTTDAYYDALVEIQSHDKSTAKTALNKLLYHLNSILEMEYITLKSVF